MKSINYPVKNGNCTMLCPVNNFYFVGSASCLISCNKSTDYDEKQKTIGCKPLNKKLHERARN